MKFATRIIATMAFASLLSIAAYADDTAKPAAPGKKDEAASSGVAAPAPKTNAAPLPDFAAWPAAPLRSTPWPQEHAGQAMNSHSDHHGHHGMDDADDGTPRVELFLGYSYWRAIPYSTGNRIEYLNGGSASLAYNFNRHWGLVGDFAGFSTDSVQFNAAPGTTGSRVVDAEGKVFTYMLGPRYSFRSHSRLTPFLQVLVGVAHADEVVLDCKDQIYACRPLPSENAFALTAGGGLDYRLTHRVAVRLFQAEYLLTRFDDPSSLTGDKSFQNNIRLSAGLLFRFGGDRVELPSSPTVSCRAEKTMVYVGSNDLIVLHAEASDPQSRPLNFTWSADGGTAEGTGADIRWNSTQTTPGTYVVRVRVDNSHGGTADCSVNIRVEQRPNRPPTISCSTDRSPIVQGESAGISANASDPDDDALTYSYSASGGRIAGNGQHVQFDSTGVAPGSYNIKCSVSDSHGGMADASTGVEVQAPAPSPEIHELETRLALHSIYFATARPTEQNPGGGLVESQQDILEKLATDFKRYLTFKPDAHLILGGHADSRGSVEYNKRLTDRRVARTRAFLAERGVPASAIDVRSYGEEDQLTAEQVKKQMQENPDLTAEEHRRALSNLQIIVLANNRRVDVSLSTTGQQSVRQYPFNAKDAMTLISPRGGTKESPAPMPRKRPSPDRRKVRSAFNNADAVSPVRAEIQAQVHHRLNLCLMF